MTVMTKTRFDVVPRTRYIGAEIRGLDLRQKPDEATIKAIYQAWLDHLVVVFPGQNLSQEDLMRVTGYFGEQGVMRRPAKFFPQGYSKILPGIMLISNIRENGEPIGALPDGEMHFHSDQCHQEIPAKATVLYAIEVPSRGGNTLFANGYAAYETLPESMKHRIAGRRALNAYDKDSTLRTASYENAGSSFWHPVVRTHPATRRKALYVNRLMTREIEGLSREESDALLQKLFDHQEQRKFVYEHVWRPGDILMWDNRCAVHARTDFPAGERRLLRRVTILGERPV